MSALDEFDFGGWAAGRSTLPPFCVDSPACLLGLELEGGDRSLLLAWSSGENPRPPGGKLGALLRSSKLDLPSSRGSNAGLGPAAGARGPPKESAAAGGRGKGWKSEFSGLNGWPSGKEEGGPFWNDGGPSWKDG